MSKLLKQIVIAGLIITGSVFSQVLYNVSGMVLLEDSVGVGTHEDVKIKFYNLPSMDPEDSTYSQATGLYSINISPGYYLVEWTRDGYVPWELGGLSLAANTVLDTVTLIPGEIQEVNGNVSGTWTTSFVYHVMSDITVPAGDSLTINPGVRVKFAAGTGMTCNGKLKALGTSDEHILFTSKEPTPLPGDWVNLTLNTSRNTLQYIDYEWAEDGIVGTGYNGHTTIDHLTINGTLSLTANGIYINNGDYLSITNNYIAVAGEYGIFVNDGFYSEFVGNTIITPTFGLKAETCTGCLVDSNLFTTGDNTTGPENAIWTDGSNQITITNNTIIADMYGVRSANSYKAQIIKNCITGRIYWGGIWFSSSDSSVIYKNYIQRTLQNGNNGSWQYLINGSGSEGSLFRKDTLIDMANDSWAQNNRALHCDWSTVDSNYIEFTHTDDEHYTIFDECNSDITDNTIFIYSRTSSTSRIIHSNSSGSFVNRIENNSIIHDHLSNDQFRYAIWTQDNTIIRNNNISCDYLERAIYVQNNCVVDSNTISGNFSQIGLIYIAGDSVLVNHNTVNHSGTGRGIYSQGHNGIAIRDNHITHSSGAKWLSVDNSEVTIHHNLIELNTGRGIELYNQSAGSVYNNTILSQGGDYGIHLSNQTALPVYNNILHGFTNGIFAENTIQNYNLDHNNLYDISGSLLTGSAIPPLAGQIIDENANGDPCDIYGNISLDPQFVNPDSNDYNLLITSPCINAGSDNLTDPDNTVSDIGAFFHFIYIVIDHTPLESTVDTSGPYTVEAEVVSTINVALDVTLYYSTDGGANYTTVSMTPGANDTWTANIPGQVLNTTIHYYILADDGPHEVTSPFNIDNEVYSFYVTLFSQFANLGGASDTYGNIDLTWSTPIPMTGTLEELKLYRSTNPNVALTPDNLFQSFGSTVTSYTDSDVEEGDTYYYRLTGLVADGGDTTESVVSSEVGVMSDDATVVRVRGVAYLQGQSDHSGTKVYFEKTSPSAVTDSVYTNADGYYDIVVVTGIYNAHFSQDGYQPRLLGHQFFADNAWLDTLTLVPGGVVELSGNINGVLTSNNLYFIDDDVTIPAGDTLTIQAGTQVLFRGNYTLTANGLLMVNGTADNMVIISSRTPVPAVGDWGSITLNSGATGSIIKYARYKYATDGFICNGLSQFTIWGCEVNTLAINGRAITLNNCENVDIRYNTLNAPGDWVIYKPNDEWDNSAVFIGNEIQAAGNGLLARRFHNLTVDSNHVQASGTGINTEYSRNLYCRSNRVESNNSIGINAYDCDGAAIEHNDVRFSRDYGYYLQYADNIIFRFNRFYYAGPHSSVYGVYADWNQNSEYSNNHIEFSDSLGRDNHWYGFYGINNSTFRKNRVEIWKSSHSYNGGFCYINNSLFENNYIYLQSHGGDDNRRTAFSGNGNTSITDTLILGNETQGYYGSNWTIRGAIIEVPNSNNADVAINCRGGVLDVVNVTITGAREGIYGTGVGGRIRNTLIDVYGSSYGIRFDNNSTMSLYKNTITGNNTGTGIWTTTNATVLTNSVIVDGFTTGLNAESPNTIQTSLFYDNTTNFSGSDLPPQVGDVVTVNGNADPSDIYGNIFLNPLFIEPSNDDYHLLSGSPAINAGDIDSLDLDGTVADIGVYFYNYGYVPMDLVADSTGDGFVAVSWDILPSDSIQHYIPYYKLTSANDWTAANTTTESSYSFSGLTNNTSYNFAVAVQYPNHESDRSAVITAKPGLAQISLSRNYIVSERSVDAVVSDSFQISNTGSKDLDWTIISSLPGSTDISTGSIAPGSQDTIIYHFLACASIVYTSDIVVQSNDPATPLDTIEVLSIVGEHGAVPPDHFAPIGGGSDEFLVVISSAILDGSSLQSGDEVGIFDPSNGSACVGAGLMTGQYPIVITCTNYTPGALYSVKIYDYSQAREIEAQFDLIAGSASFVTDAFGYGSISGSIYQTQSLTLNPNAFNLLSSYLYPRYPEMSSVFSGLDSLEIVYNDQGQAYIPRYGINSIGNYVMVDGYHLFTRDQNPSIDISGLPINSANYPITIEAQRFNSIAYLNSNPQPVTSAMPSLTGLIEIIQDDAGGVYIPDLSVNTLGDLQPGKGYQIYIKGTTDQTITYSSPPAPGDGWQLTKRDHKKQVQQLPTTYFHRAQPTGLPYTVIIDGLTIDGHELEITGEIALFDGDLCVGASRFEGFPVVITAWGGSDEYNLPGYKAGNAIGYRVYLDQYSREFEVMGIQQTSYGGGPYTLDRITGQPGIIPREFYLGQNYPNPFNPSTKIVFGISQPSTVKLVIYDLLGRTVWQHELGDQLPGRYEIEWSGQDQHHSPVASGVYFYRLTAGDDSAVKKMILIR